MASRNLGLNVSTKVHPVLSDEASDSKQSGESRQRHKQKPKQKPSDEQPKQSVAVPQESKIDGSDPKVKEFLKSMYRRFQLKCKIYNATYVFYAHADRYGFFIPLMILQGIVALASAVLTDSSSVHRYLAGVISAISAVLLSVQNTLKFTQTAEIFDNASSMYSSLATDTFYEMSEGTKDSKGEELQDFFEDSLETEQRILDICPMPPDWIVRKYVKMQEDDDEEEAEELANDQIA